MKTSRTSLGAAVVVATLGMSACNAESSGTVSSAVPEGSGSDYADGVYSATGWYGGLPSHQDVTLTIADGTVTVVEITTPAEDETSLGYQERFAAALPDAIVGKRIDQLAIDRLAGSSGCSEGFMDALAKIKAQAEEGAE